MSGTSRITGREIERALRALTGCYHHVTGQGRTDYRATCKDIAEYVGVTKPTARKYLRMLQDVGSVGCCRETWRGGWSGETFVLYGNNLDEPIPGSYFENVR